MRVKRLEIQGFKSFKDKTVIHFDHSITGIVGPNGCGKSNIVDAFFWVMGEQSYKHMRGSGSDDLIFNGSSKYSPLGLAEATLILETDATDTENAPSGATAADVPLHIKAKEIAVTRRLYRGGEGEYFINGVPARLKDIKELFMDTGVGAKGYSIIEQGQIGKIVNAKPEERRLLIEEAAGIAKYKARKIESLRKVEATQANLSRLNDVIAEIERTLASLDRQAQKARQYKKYREELVDKEMTWGRRKIQVLREKLETLRAGKQILEQEMVGLRAELQTAENTIETDRTAQLTDTKSAEELQTRVQQLSDELTREKSSLELSRRRRSDLGAQVAAMQNEKSELDSSIRQGADSLQTLEAEAALGESAFHSQAERALSFEEALRALRTEADAARRDHEGAKRQLIEGIARSADLTSKAASLESRIASASAQAEKLADQVKTQTEKLEGIRREWDSTRGNSASIRAQRNSAREELERKNTNAKDRELALRALEQKRDDSVQALNLLRSKIESLEELTRAHEGFGEASKAALDWADERGCADLLVALTDLLDVDHGYETAMEGWLDSRLEKLVSSDATIALEAMDLARSQKNGRVAVHVSSDSETWVQSTGIPEAISSLMRSHGFEVFGRLSDFVRVKDDALGADLAARSIANVLVVRTFDPMPAFINQGHSRKLGSWSVLALDGTALDADGTLRGGSEKADGAASVLRRKRAIADLQSQAEKSLEQQNASEALLKTSRQELETTRARVQELQVEAQHLEVQAAALERDVHQTDRAVADAGLQLGQLEAELSGARQEAESARQERSQIEASVNAFTTTRTELEARIAAGETVIDERAAILRAREEEMQSARISEAQVRERSSSLKRELDAGRSVIEDRRRRLTEVERVLERSTRELQEFTGGEAQIDTKIEELTLVVAEARGRLALVKDRLEQSAARINAALERLKELHKAADEKNAEITQAALETEKSAAEISHLTQNLEEKYGPDCLERPSSNPVQEEMTEPVVTAEMTAEEELLLGEEVERLRERIRRLGDVNPEAVDQYDETRKRYDYLVGEKLDLEKSIENLQEAIEHINKTSEERFKKAFQAIADRFERLFPIIFGGGQANLSLVLPEGSTDILEAGVDILAQPPGKKIVNISLLSGGEKALTAVSMIFAIFMVKPSPFCVLDEVDAPLDDANIGKFNALLREMSIKSQFILITHNKKTMELNDTLYGVTMEEPGVSKMVSIELR